MLIYSILQVLEALNVFDTADIDYAVKALDEEVSVLSTILVEIISQQLVLFFVLWSQSWNSSLVSLCLSLVYRRDS